MENNPYSNLKILWHPDKLKALRKGVVTAPLYVRIKPTNRCNHRCFYCAYADKKLGLHTGLKRSDEIPWPRLKKAIMDMADMKVKAVTFSGGGEPLVYPSIRDAFRLVLRKGIELSLITNGQLLQGEVAELLHGAKWVRVSLDSFDAKKFLEIRGLTERHFNEILKNIRTFSHKKEKSCELGINFVITHKNASQVYRMTRLLKGLGVNHVKYTARITKDLFAYHSKFRDQAIRQIQKAKKDFEDDHFKVVNKYEDDFRLSMLFERSYSNCPIMQIVTVIAADSKVYLCHDKAYVSNGELGSLAEKSFKAIWFSPKTRKFFKDFDPQKSCHHHCVYDERNIFINKIIQDADRHVNFI